MVTTSWLTISTNPHFSADLFIFTKKTPVSQPFKSPVSTGSFPLLIDLSRFPGLPRFSTGITSHKTISDSETISAAFQSVLLWRIKLFTLLKVPENHRSIGNIAISNSEVILSYLSLYYWNLGAEIFKIGYFQTNWSIRKVSTSKVKQFSFSQKSALFNKPRV